jgi:LuxR family maltose regulon positive regulatory protein
VDARGRPLPSAAIPHLLRGWLHYDANRLDEAREATEQGRALLRLAFRETLLTPLEIELPALLHEAAGETEEALAVVHAGQERAIRQQYRQAIQAAGRIEADLLLRHDRLDDVRRWAAGEAILARENNRDVEQVFGATYDAIYLTYARLLLAEERADEARALLDPLAASARAGQRGRSLIAIRLLQAVAAAEPLPPLLAAVQQAAAEAYLRPIIDECSFPAHGPRLVALLQQQAVHAAAPAFVDAVLAAFPAATTAADEAPATATTTLLEPLTEQEEVVLRLLVAGMSNREIAEELVITVGTAKWHVHNVYQKLNVGSRAEAVARAYEANLLDP